MSIDEAEIDRRFNHHPPSPDKIMRHQSVRDAFKSLTLNIVLATPSSREQSLAITALEEAMFWVNAAIAREGK